MKTKTIRNIAIVFLLVSATIYVLAEREEPQTVVRGRTFSPPKKTKPYIVKDGEYLSLIAARLPNRAWDSDYLAKLNKLEKPWLIKPGQKIVIPVE